MLDQMNYATSKSVLNVWFRPTVEAPLSTLTQEQIGALRSALNTYIIAPYAVAYQALLECEAQVVSAKTSYDLMLKHEVNAQLMADALVSLKAAVESYVNMLNDYDSYTYSISEENMNAYIAGTDATIANLNSLLTREGEKVVVSAEQLEAFIFGEEEMDIHSTIGVKEIYDAYVAALEADGYYNAQDPAASYVNVRELLNIALNAKDEPEEPEQPEEPETPVDPENPEEGDVVVPDAPKSKYAVDNNVVAVTYGESKDDPYKTLLLNFNDYTIQTVYNGVTYTIAAYEYVVIIH